MYYVYILKSILNPEKIYAGYSTNLKQRLETQNSGGSIHTALNRPWELIYYSVFKNIDEAKKFEEYLKTPSGKAFALKRLLSK
jgi:putative endonuclease